MKQTAIEWLIEQLENHNGVTRSGFEKCIQQAKAMEKDQIMDAYWEIPLPEEKYFEKTFKSE